MRTSWNDAEDDALQGLPLRAQVMYLRGIRRYMDFSSRICGGAGRRISLGMLAETAQECVNRQLLPKASKDGIRASLEQLKRAGLIRRIDDPDYLVFFLPLADADKSVPQYRPTAAPQPARSHRPPDETAPGAAAAADRPPTPHPQAGGHRPTHPAPENRETISLPGGREAQTPPYRAIVALYHECLPALPKVYKLTEQRRRWIKALCADELEDLDCWRNYFRHVARSDFLMGRCPGRDGAPFFASFDFIIHPAKFVKIAEEHYHAKKIPGPRS